MTLYFRYDILKFLSPHLNTFEYREIQDWQKQYNSILTCGKAPAISRCWQTGLASYTHYNTTRRKQT